MTEELPDMQAILVGHEVIKVGFREYAEWMMQHKHIPRSENFKNHPADLTRVGWDEVDSATVSTVFLGIDHGFGLGPSLWFETMIFGGDHGGFCRRYATWDQAKAGHDHVVAALREGHSPDHEGHDDSW